MRNAILIFAFILTSQNVLAAVESISLPKQPSPVKIQTAKPDPVAATLLQRKALCNQRQHEYAQVQAALQKADSYLTQDSLKRQLRFLAQEQHYFCASRASIDSRMGPDR